MLSRTGMRRLLIPELSLFRVLLSIAFVNAAIAVLAWLYADRMIFLPPPLARAVALPGGARAEASPGHARRAHHNDFMWVAGERYAQALREFEALLRGR